MSTETDVLHLLAEFGRLSEDTTLTRDRTAAKTAGLAIEGAIRDLLAPRCSCGNQARYIDERGQLCCSLCPLRERLDSIRISDVPRLLAWARSYLSSAPAGTSDELRAITGRDVKQQSI